MGSPLYWKMVYSTNTSPIKEKARQMAREAYSINPEKARQKAKEA